MGVGVWVAVDPAGFQDIVAARAVLSAGAWLLLAVGIALSLLGFLGCCGALRRSRPLLLLVREGRWVGRGCRMWAGHWGQESRAGGWWGMQVFLEEPGAGVPHPQHILPSTPHLVSLNLESREFIKPSSGVNSL